MLKKPLLAKCSNRTQLAKIHPTAGEPQDWLHEQSHATRNAGGAPEEEIEAQLETYRMCDDTQFKSFRGFDI